jgi:hypothetical protein
LSTVAKSKLDLDPERLTPALEVAQRISWLPFPFEVRAALCASLVLTKALYGGFVAQSSKGQLRQLRIRFSKAIWGSGRRFRCAEIILTLFAQDHRLDQEQAAVCQALSAFHQVLVSNPRLRAAVSRSRRSYQLRLPNPDQCSVFFFPGHPRPSVKVGLIPPPQKHNLNKETKL